MNQVRRGVLMLALMTLAGCGSDSGGSKPDSSTIDSGGDSTAAGDSASPDLDSADSGLPIDSRDAAPDVQADASTDGEQDGVLTGSCASRIVTVSTFCIENATAKAGETVDVDVYLLVPAGCTKITQSTVKIALPSGVSAETLDWTNDQLCRGLRAGSDGTYTLLQLSSSATSRCPVSLPIGLFRTVKLTLADTVAAGEYPLELSSPWIGDNLTATECRNGGNPYPSAPAILGTLTVRP